MNLNCSIIEQFISIFEQICLNNKKYFIIKNISEKRWNNICIISASKGRIVVAVEALKAILHFHKMAFIYMGVEKMGFSLFGTYHIGWLIFIIITVVLVSKYFKKSDVKNRKVIQKSIAWFILLFEIFKDIYLIIGDEFSVKYLPFELCSLAIFAIFYHAYTDSNIIGEMLYNIFLPGAIAALLFCNWTYRPIFGFMCSFSFIFHLSLVTYSVMVLYAGIVKPNKNRILNSVLFLAIAGLIIYPLNKMWDTNFMFLNAPSPGSPLVPLESIFGNPGYIFGLACIIILLWVVIYLPWNKLLRPLKQMISNWKTKLLLKYNM